MDRRHAVALSLGLVLCLALLGRWSMEDEPNTPADPVATSKRPAEPSPAAPASIIQNSPSVKPAAKMDDSGRFRGQIVDAVTREPVNEFELEFHPPFPSDSPKPPLYSFNSKDGRFECRDVPVGVWTVFATARGYQRFELPNVEIVSDRPLPETVIPMRRGQVLHGRVFDESTDGGIAGATLTFREAHIGPYQGNFRIRPSTTSQKDGEFSLNGLPTGPVIVSVSANDYGPRDVEVTIGNKTSPLEIGLSTGGTIAGYLAGADGLTPVAGIISLIDLDQGSGGTSRTGSAGEFKFSNLQAARYRLSGRAAGLSGEREITITHNEQYEGIVLAMRGGHSIRGVVSGLSPEDLQSTTVSANRENSLGPSVDVAVDNRGAFALTGVAPGLVRVSANVQHDRALSKLVTMPGDTDLTVNLEFPRGSRLTGRVTRGGKPLSGVLVAPSPAQTAEGLDQFFYGVTSAANGDYAIENLPKQQYTLQVDSYRSQSVRVDGDTVFDVDVPMAHLAGRLLEEGSKVPVVDASVHLWTAQATNVRLGTRSDHFGQFAVQGMQPGDFVISVYKPGYELYRGPLAYGSPISDLIISLRPAKGVEIKVRDAATGRAVGGLMAIEGLKGRPGIPMQLNLDQNGIAYLPSGMAGSTLTFSALGYATAQIADWDGEPFEMDMQPEATQ